MLAPGTSVSATICCLSLQLQRRRRSTVITSARCIVLEVRLSLLLEPWPSRHPTSRRAHRAAAAPAALHVRLEPRGRGVRGAQSYRHRLAFTTVPLANSAVQHYRTC